MIRTHASTRRAIVAVLTLLALAGCGAMQDDPMIPVAEPMVTVNPTGA